MNTWRERHGLKYAVPKSLDDLKGPSDGIVELPLILYWTGTSSKFDLSKDRDVCTMYRAVMREGTLEEICKYLNKDLMLKTWDINLLGRDMEEAWKKVIEDARK